MGRSKLDKFRDNEQSHHVIQQGKPLFDRISGRWGQMYFGNDHPIVVELACGRGEYTVGLARIFPDKNFIGVDIKGPRIWRGSRIAGEENLKHVAFLRTQIQNLDRFFGADEIDEVWITFPDPRPKLRDERRRLTHPRFLAMYRQLVKPAGLIHLKTDNQALFEYSLETIANTEGARLLDHTFDLYQSELIDRHYGIRTYYESIYLEEKVPIKYLTFCFNDRE